MIQQSKERQRSFRGGERGREERGRGGEGGGTYGKKKC